jgi:hypothetical protein
MLFLFYCFTNFSRYQKNNVKNENILCYCKYLYKKQLFITLLLLFKKDYFNLYHFLESCFYLKEDNLHLSTLFIITVILFKSLYGLYFVLYLHFIVILYIKTILYC